MEDVRSLRYGCLVHYYCLGFISIHRGYTTDSNNVPDIHIKVNVCLPLYVHFFFMLCEKDASVS